MSKMIKRYNEFVEKKTNEEFVFADPKPATQPTKPGTIEKPITPEEPVLPGPIRRERTSPIPAPAKAQYEEEEEGVDLYTNKLQELADLLGVEVENGYVVYNGKKIMFPSETEKYQIEGVKKGFTTAQEVLNELEKSVSNSAQSLRVKETEQELTSLEDDEMEEEIEKMESKSYKNSRLKRIK
jgi:hypothetical protein